MKVLVIRRDNIGDLVCTTPLFTALRRRFPDAEVDVLVNTYNADVLTGHPDVDNIHVYEKAKHRGARFLATTYADRIRLLTKLRGKRFDCVILAGPGVQRRSLFLAGFLKARSIIGFCEGRLVRGISVPVDPAGGEELHEVEDIFRLLMPLGISGSPPATLVVDQRKHAEYAKSAWLGQGPAAPRVAVHVSARKPSQRWPAERFAELLTQLYMRGAATMLLWSPGGSGDARHPGDDAKAARIMDLAGDVGCTAYPTSELSMLIGGIASCQLYVGADGGAMHLAAALKKPVVSLFGDSNPVRWRPWSVPHVVLQPASRDVVDVSVSEVLSACEDLLPALRVGG